MKILKLIIAKIVLKKNNCQYIGQNKQGIWYNVSPIGSTALMPYHIGLFEFKQVLEKQINKIRKMWKTEVVNQIIKAGDKNDSY